MDNNDKITVFAKTNFRGKELPFGIKTDDRRRHMYLIGKTGMGKTTVMENMVIQDIRNGNGVAFLDPHGDSIQRILNSIPASRVNDVVYFNPADLDHPVAFNILESVDIKYKHLVASGLMGVFTKIWANLWSARMEYILNNTILALLDSPGNTLLGITRMYVDKKYRKKIVDNIKDPMVRAFWVDEFANYNEKYRTEAIAPIQNKVGQFLSSGIIRNIVGQPKSTVDMREIMDQRKILIMDLSKGKVGEDNSALLGAMIVTKLQLAAMSRTDVVESERKDFYLYVDEFQNFATDSFATILSEARKYRLNLIVGHQYIGQLVQERNTKVRDAIFGNVGTLAVFRVGAEDAEFLVKEFEPVFNEVDIVNLPKYHIVLKLMINGVASDPFSATTLSPNPETVTGNGEKVIRVSRERYSNAVAEVEEKISRWMGAEYHQDAAIVIGKESDDGVATALAEQPKLIRAEVAVSGQDVEETLKIGDETLKTEVTVAPPKAMPTMVEQRPRPREESRQFNGDRNQSQRHSQPRPDQHHHQRQNSQPPARQHQQNFNRTKPPQKKENPIWNQVAEIHDQKKRQFQEKTKATIGQLLAPRESSEPATQPRPQAPTASQPHVFTPQTAQPERTILKPGDSHQL
ncbi:MAG: type IV secretion system DNA-binding domain-containing protein [Candidatus Doudnabacteria bacterium]|nr:type IV secretion system DNA-binding domain-containing protein [Candidatus Doudnabacteria bacterium]